MATTLDDFLKAKSAQEINALLEAQRKLDPYTYLNVKFSVEEAQRYRGNKSGAVSSLSEAIYQEKMARLEDLKSKTETALNTRKLKFNETYFKFNPNDLGNPHYSNPWARALTSYQAVLDNVGSDIHQGWFSYRINNNHTQGLRFTLMKAGRSFNTSIILDVLHQCFPSVRLAEYYNFPHLFAYMEEVPWPTPEQFDSAYKMMLGWGTEEYAKDALYIMERWGAVNANPQSAYNYYFVPNIGNPYFYSGHGRGESTYALPTRNESYDKNQKDYYTNNNVGKRPLYWETSSWSSNAKDLKSYDMSIHYYSARPKVGFYYVHKIGYLNPLYLTDAHILYHYSNYGWNNFLVERANKRKKGGWGIIFGGAVKTVGMVAGNMINAVNPIRIQNDIFRSVPIYKDIFREFENLTGGLLTQVENVTNIPSRALLGEGITERDWMQALDLGIKVAIILGTAGSATALATQVGMVSSQLQRGTLGKTELGRSLLTTGEILAASAILNQSIANAALKVGEREGIRAGTREVGNLTDLNRTIIGNIALEAAVTSGQSAAHGGSWGEALTESLKKGGLVAIAEENPILGLVTSISMSMIDNPGLSDTIDGNDPESAFDSFSWDSIPTSFSELAQTMNHENFKRLIGIAILAATGRFNANAIMDSFARDLSMRHISKFHSNEKVLTFDTGPTPEENIILQGVNDAKAEINLLERVVNGHIPNPRELSAIANSDVANYLNRMIKDVLPTDLQGSAFKMAFDLGLPDIDLSLNLGLEIPEWAKIQKIEVPEWAKITGHEEWNKNLQREAENFKNKVIDAATWENFLSAYLRSLWPPNMPLRQVGDGSGNRNYIDTNGFVSVREPWNVSHLHPFLQHNLIMQRKSKDQIEYENARDKELENAKKILMEQGVIV